MKKRLKILIIILICLLILLYLNHALTGCCSCCHNLGPGESCIGSCCHCWNIFE